MDPFIGEIRVFAGNFPPRGWAFCDGQLLSISEYTSLFSLLGTRYGGDGRSTFAVPDLRGRVPIGTGQGSGLSPVMLAQRFGCEYVPLDTMDMPAHSHTLRSTASSTTEGLTVEGTGTIKCCSTSGNKADPTGAFPARTRTPTGDKIYTTDEAKATGSMNAAAVELNGTVQGQVDVTVTSVCDDAGGGLKHYNMQPWLGVNFIIALAGTYPSRS